MSPVHNVLWVGVNTAIVAVRGLANDAGAFVNDATVEIVDIYDRVTGDPVAGVTLPINAPYIVSSDGVYRAVIPSTAQFAEGKWYMIKVAASANGLDAEWLLAAFAKRRTA